LRNLSTSFVLGYHGCDQSTADKIISGEAFEPSVQEHDWLGRGVYFWEANPERGLEWAQERAANPKPKIKIPAVVGGIIDLGRCLDLTTKESLDLVKAAYAELSSAKAKALPDNGKDKMRRNLDCAVINRLYSLLEEAGEQPFQTVRGVFTEGGELYPGAGIEKKTHIQIAVVDPDCIKGAFRPRPYPAL